MCKISTKALSNNKRTISAQADDPILFEYIQITYHCLRKKKIYPITVSFQPLRKTSISQIVFSKSLLFKVLC